MKVCKFGGSSVASAAQVSKVCDIVIADPERRLIVVSAPGKRRPDDSKVTDLLIACAERRLEGGSADEELAAVIDRFVEIQRGLGLPESLSREIEEDLRCRRDSGGGHAGQFLDRMKAAGEDNCARLVAGELSRRRDARYVNPREAGLLLSAEHGNAQVLPESYDNLAKLGDEEGIMVFPGFFGYTEQGDVATFPRGGSDITGSILAAAVSASVYENFTDVDSVFAADPGIVPRAKAISELTFREMRELAYAGFGVLHDEAIVPAVRAGVPICIKNTNAPDARGTRIVKERTHTDGKIVGIASDDGFCTIFVSKYLMNREIGFGRRLLDIFEREGLSYEHMPSGIDNLSIILREADLTAEMEKRVLSAIESDLGADSIEMERGLALVMIVGEGMRYAVGLAARATKAFADAGVNIEMMNQGSSEISMMFGLKGSDREHAVRALYDTFFGPE